MADSTSVVMNLTSSLGTKTTKSITNVSQDASNGDIVSFANGLNSLTTDTLNSVTKIQKTELASSYPTLDVTIGKDNDNNNAITINGYNITIDQSKLPNSSNLFEYGIIEIEHQTVDIAKNIKISCTPMRNSIMAGLLFIQPDTAIITIYVKKAVGSGQYQTYDITLSDLKLNETKYNDITIHIEQFASFI